MINEDRPNSGVPQTELNIGSGFILLVGDIYKLIIGPLNLLGGVNNAFRLPPYETWDTIGTTWATETRTWILCSSRFIQASKPVSSFTNVTKP